MPDLEIVPSCRPPGGEAARHYLVDMIEQLAQLARRSGEVQIAILLEAVLAADQAVSGRT